MQYDNYIIAAVFKGFTCFTCFRLRPHLQECLSGQFGLPALSQALCQVAACLDGQPQAPCKMSRGVCQISRSVTHMPLRTIFRYLLHMPQRREIYAKGVWLPQNPSDPGRHAMEWQFHDSRISCSVESVCNY